MHLHQKHSLLCIIDFHQKCKAITFAFASKIFSILYHWLSSKMQGYNLWICINNILYFVSLTFIKKQGYNLWICIKNIIYFVSLTFIKKVRLQPLHLHQKYSLFCIIDFHQKYKVITFAFASKTFSSLYHWLSSKMQGYNLCICIKNILCFLSLTVITIARL